MASIKPNTPTKRSSKRPNFIILIIFIVVLVAITLFNIPKTTYEEIKKDERINITPIDAAKQFNSQNAIDFSTRICDLGPRYGGNEAEHKAAEMLETEFQKKNINVTKEKVDLGDGKYTYNVIGKIEGTSNPNEYIIIGSHIDSPENAVGATDGASGQGIQVEMARILAKSNTNKTILLVGFGAEMLWFKGSEDFVNKHPDIVKNCTAMMDLNVVGAGAKVAPISSSNLPETVIADPKLLDLLQQCADELGVPLLIDQDTYPSDTYYFYKFNESKIPVVQIESRPFNVPPWASENTPDKLSNKDMENVGQTLIMTTLKISEFGYE